MLNVEFIGGPFDGHHQACLVTSGELPSHVIRLVCDDAFRQLEETTQVQARIFTSVAFYGLDRQPDSKRYLFTKSISFTEFNVLLRHMCSSNCKTIDLLIER